MSLRLAISIMVTVSQHVLGDQLVKSAQRNKVVDVHDMRKEAVFKPAPTQVAFSVVNAGTSRYQGEYLQVGMMGGVPAYSKPSGPERIFYHLYGAWVMADEQGDTYYFKSGDGDQPPEEGWYYYFGELPLPYVQYEVATPIPTSVPTNPTSAPTPSPTQAHAECPATSQFVRVRVQDGTCESQGYYTIGDLDTCNRSFDECAMSNDTKYHTIQLKSYNFMYNGCQSQCFLPFAGHFCQYFNTGSCTKGDCSSFYGSEAFLLCQKAPPPTPPPTTAPPTENDGYGKYIVAFMVWMFVICAAFVVCAGVWYVSPNFVQRWQGGHGGGEVGQEIQMIA